MFQSASVVADSSINISSLYFHNHVNDIKQSWALSTWALETQRKKNPLILSD